MEKVEGLSLMAIFAHPDDESFGNGGTLARYAAEGVFTSLVCATRGEAGEISDPALATPDTLGQVREQELRSACSILGVDEVRFLDYVDGTLATVDERDGTSKMVLALREIRPQVVITFGPDGVYGHPDHVAVHCMATAAFHAAGDSSAFPEQLSRGLAAWGPLKLYYVAPPREQFRQLGEWAARVLPHTTWSTRDWDSFGVPEARITTRLDVGCYSDTKLAAIFAHQTQIQPSHPYSLLPQDLLKTFFGKECYVLAESRVGPAVSREDDLFQGIRVEVGSRYGDTGTRPSPG